MGKKATKPQHIVTLFVIALNIQEGRDNIGTVPTYFTPNTGKIIGRSSDIVCNTGFKLMVTKKGTRETNFVCERTILDIGS